MIYVSIRSKRFASKGEVEICMKAVLEGFKRVQKQTFSIGRGEAVTQGRPGPAGGDRRSPAVTTTVTMPPTNNDGGFRGGATSGVDSNGSSSNGSSPGGARSHQISAAINLISTCIDKAGCPSPISTVERPDASIKYSDHSNHLEMTIKAQ